MHFPSTQYSPFRGRQYSTIPLFQSAPKVRYVLSEPGAGIDWNAVLSYLEVQMRTGAHASTPY